MGDRSDLLVNSALIHSELLCSVSCYTGLEVEAEQINETSVPKESLVSNRRVCSLQLSGDFRLQRY